MFLFHVHIVYHYLGCHSASSIPLPKSPGQARILFLQVPRGTPRECRYVHHVHQAKHGTCVSSSHLTQHETCRPCELHGSTMASARVVWVTPMHVRHLRRRTCYLSWFVLPNGSPHAH